LEDAWPAEAERAAHPSCALRRALMGPAWPAARTRPIAKKTQKRAECFGSCPVLSNLSYLLLKELTASVTKNRRDLCLLL